MRYVLIWSVRGGEKRHVLGRGQYFIGRLSSEDVSRLGIRSPDYFGVYIFPAEGSGEAVHTGLCGVSVSRRHAKLFYEAVNGRPTLHVMDHGPKGNQSKNGTYVNERKILPGRKARLKEGDVLKLSTLGPAFIIGVEKKGITELRLRSGVPTEVPRSLANELIGAEAVGDYHEVGESAIIVLKNVHAVRLDDKIIKIEAPSEKIRKIETLARIKECLHYAIRYLLEDRETDALIKLNELNMQTYRQAIQNLNDPTIQKTYDELTILIRYGEQSPEKLKNAADKLLNLLQAIKP